PPATPPTPRPPKPLAGRSRKLPCSPSPPIPPCALSATPTCAATREGSRQNRQSPDPFPPTPARTPSVAGFPDRSPQPALAPPATLRWLSPSPTRPPHLAAPPYGIHPSEHHRPGGPISGFWPGGELQEPHQCSIAFLEPCCLRGIRTNEDRALTAVVFSHSISPTLPHAKSHTIQSGLRPVAVLPSAFRGSPGPAKGPRRLRPFVSRLLAPHSSLLFEYQPTLLKVKPNLQVLEATKCRGQKGRNETTIASNPNSSRHLTKLRLSRSIMNLDFEWDDLKAAENVRHHGVSFAQAA